MTERAGGGDNPIKPRKRLLLSAQAASAEVHRNEAYAVIRSARRTIALEVRADGAVAVRAPQQMVDQDIARFVDEHAAWIAAARRRQANRTAAQAEQSQDPDELRAAALALLPGRLAAWAARMGVEPAALTITGAKTRLGSCSSADRICLSYNLMRWPDAVIDYVIVHELAHIRHKNHSRAFYAEIARHLPAYREALAILRGR